MPKQIFQVSKDLKSQMAYGSFDFPFSIYYDLPTEYDLDFIRWHWHKEIQFSIIVKGAIEITLSNQKYRLKKGDCLFINASRLHRMEAINYNSIVVNIIFDPIFISGTKSSVLYIKYFYPILVSNLDGFYLEKNDGWQGKIIDKLCKVYQLYNESEHGYELEIISYLSSLWKTFSIYLIACFDLADKKESKIDRRLKIMLDYIEENYSRSISLNDISKSAYISESEACRYFKENLDTSPFQYLIQYRITEAARLLRETNESITGVMNMVGFNNPSYFSKVFKNFTNRSPSNYRKNF